MRLTRPIFLALAAGVGMAAPAWAGEADDLQRMIDVARQGATSLERLDEQKVAREDLTLLQAWLATAWRQRSEEKYSDVRVTLDRVQAQADMIRQRIDTAKLVKEAEEKEAELQKVRQEIAKTREAIQAATVKKATLEARAK